MLIRHYYFFSIRAYHNVRIVSYQNNLTYLLLDS